MRREENRAYSVELPKLKNGLNHFVFDVSEEFFAGFEQPLIREGQIQIQVELKKNLNQLDAFFRMKGFVQLSCDRCDEPFQFPVEIEKRLVYAYQDQGVEEDDYEELIYLDPKNHLLDLRQEMYDFICLEVPIRKVPEGCDETCPRYPAAVLLPEQDAVSEVGDEEVSDPRWAILNKLKFDDLNSKN
jgi:uncharacterized metal-binding protein YceD (DUF177 family)